MDGHGRSSCPHSHWSLIVWLVLAACGGSDIVGPDGSTDGSMDASSVDAGRDAANDTSVLDAAVPDDGTVAWVLSYFGPSQSLAADSLHLAYSTDGLHFTQLGTGPAYVLSGFGSNHIRDPFILRKNDGTFVYLATDWTLAENDANYWNRPSSKIVVADSTDLISFTNTRLVTVTSLPGPNAQAMHAWAPEAFYDTERGEYGIIWSGNDTNNDNRIYASYTTNFASIVNPSPVVYFDPGYPVIDGTVIQWNGINYLFFKHANPIEDIQIARSSNASLAAGNYSIFDPSYVGTTATNGRTLEGAFVVKSRTQNRWYMFADKYNEGGVFGAWTTTNLDADPASWAELPSSAFSFPAGVRHANTVRVTQAELDALIAHYGVAVTSRLRTTYAEGGQPFYVAHSWFHGMITNLDDPNQPDGDFAWRIVPGLADPADPDLVSFEPVGFPGHYLRIDSADPTRYPTCPHGANRGVALCAYVDVADRHHLTWVDPYQDSDTFRSDATFRRVPALNGNAAMVSFQWQGDATRYLRHMAYQLFGIAAVGATQMNDASFVIENP